MSRAVVVRRKRPPDNAPTVVRAGDNVEVISGPLRGLVGLLKEYKRRDRVIIAFKLNHREVLVELDHADTNLPEQN